MNSRMANNSLLIEGTSASKLKNTQDPNIATLLSFMPNSMNEKAYMDYISYEDSKY